MIAHIPDARDLNRQPLSAFKPLFSTLPPPDVDTLPGVYETAFTGPEWLRLSAGASLALIGLGGWWGMHFTAEGGNNLVLRQRKIQRLFPFRTTLAASVIDAMPAIIVRYTADCPFPWQHIYDEVRQIEPGRLLGMRRIEVPGLQRMPLPYLLVRSVNGWGMWDRG
jgi:hypothetical protein